MVDLHIRYSKLIETAMKQAFTDGTPVNPPIWWIDPTDDVALGIGDGMCLTRYKGANAKFDFLLLLEFLLGKEILVAPILTKFARSRNIYLPQGHWMDGNDPENIIKGPKWLKNYNAPLNVLPYFIKQ